MKTLRKQCANCGKIIGARKFNLKTNQTGFTITSITIDCPKCECPNIIEVKESKK